MRHKPGAQSGGNKGLSSDLTASLGFLSVKVPQPASVSIDRFAVEQFFHNYCRPDLSVVMTADHIEHGFKEIVEASQTVELSDLKVLVDHIFIFAFCHIVTGDGQERSRLFIRRQAKFTSFPPQFIEVLGRVDENSLDQYPEITQFVMNPCSHEFSREFYENLNTFLSDRQVPGLIYLLKHFLHDERTPSSEIRLIHATDHNETNLKFRIDNVSLPFSESNVPQVVQKVHHYADFKGTRNIPTLSMRRSVARQPHLPSLTSLTVPNDALIVAMSPCSSAVAYTLANELFYVDLCQTVKKLCVHKNRVSSLSFSSCGKYLLIGDVRGNVVIQNVESGAAETYQSVREAITASSFCHTNFAVGTISGVIYVYDVRYPRVQRVLAYHRAGITFLSLHPNCENLVSASQDGSIRLFSISLGACVRVWKRNDSGAALSCRFSSDGKMIVTTYRDGSLVLIDAGSSKIVRTLSIEADLIDAMFSPDDETLAIIDKTGGFSLWSVSDRTSDALIVLRIGKIRPATLSFLDCDEIRVVGCATTNRYFD